MSDNNYLIYFLFQIISLQQNCMNQQCYYDKKYSTHVPQKQMVHYPLFPFSLRSERRCIREKL
jgi:hypothetical protein